MTPEQRNQFKSRVKDRLQKRREFIQQLTPAEREQLRSMPQQERREFIRQRRENSR